MGVTPTKIADVYDWAFEANVDLLPVDIKGDYFHKFIPDAGGARFTAKRRVQTFSVFSLLPLEEAVNAGQYLFRLDLVDASGSYAQIQGQGYLASGGLTAPHDVVDDSLEIIFDGVWTQT